LDCVRDYLNDTVRSVHQKTAVQPKARGWKSGIHACSHGGTGIPGASTLMQHYRQLGSTSPIHSSTCVLVLCISTWHQASIPSKHREMLSEITCITRMRGACKQHKTCDQTPGAAYTSNPPQLRMQHESHQPSVPSLPSLDPCSACSSHAYTPCHIPKSMHASTLI
jgi:hypothetical protein